MNEVFERAGRKRGSIFPALLFVAGLIAVLGCSSQDRPTQEIAAGSPAEVVRHYWAAARDGNPKELGRWITDRYPEKWWDDAHSEKADPANTDGPPEIMPAKSDPDLLKMTRDFWPKSIKQRRWTIDALQDESPGSARATVVVTVADEKGRMPLKLKFLFSNVEGQWKIFMIESKLVVP